MEIPHGYFMSCENAVLENALNRTGKTTPVLSQTNRKFYESEDNK